jgi:hypothetical protein
MADETNVVKDEKQEVTSESGSETKKDSSQEELQLPKTLEEYRKAIQKNVSDYMAKRGDKAKTLEERVNTLESENKALKKSQLEATAKKYNLKVEQVESLGIDDPSKLEAMANLFTKTTETPTTEPPPAQPSKPVPNKVDSGKSSGGSDGKLTPEIVAKMSADEKFARRVEIDALLNNLSYDSDSLPKVVTIKK